MSVWGKGRDGGRTEGPAAMSLSLTVESTLPPIPLHAPHVPPPLCLSHRRWYIMTSSNPPLSGVSALTPPRRTYLLLCLPHQRCRISSDEIQLQEGSEGLRGEHAPPGGEGKGFRATVIPSFMSLPPTCMLAVLVSLRCSPSRFPHRLCPPPLPSPSPIQQTISPNRLRLF